jgi:hypothetical protein
MSTAAIIIAIQNKIIRKFRTTGTTNPKSAKTIEELGIRHQLLFNKLVRKGVIVQNGSKYYLNEQRADTFIQQRRRTIFVVLALVFAAIALYALIN